MREILFRGKDDNGNWCYGYAIIGKRLKWASILPIDTIDDAPPMFDENEVELDTVGQYTGLTDKNGIKIFEGDIILSQEFRNKPFSKNYKSKRLIGVVEYYDRKLNDGKQIYKSGYRVRFINDNEKSFYNCGAWSDFYDCEVIGNIHDNPEILEKI